MGAPGRRKGPGYNSQMKNQKKWGEDPKNLPLERERREAYREENLSGFKKREGVE